MGTIFWGVLFRGPKPFKKYQNKSGWGTDYTDVRCVFEKDDKTETKNLRSVIIFPTLSKVQERLIYDQLYPYFNQIFSKFQCGFARINHNLSLGHHS